MSINRLPVNALPVGATPAGDLEGAKLAWELRLDDPEKATFLAVEIDSFQTGEGLSRERFSTHDFITQPDDTPPSTTFQGRIGRGDGRRSSFVISRAIPTRDGFYGGLIRPTYSDIEISNQDGELDAYFQRAFDGRRVAIYSGLLTKVGLTDSSGDQITESAAHRIAESGDYRITESGDVRETE